MEEMRGALDTRFVDVCTSVYTRGSFVTEAFWTNM